MIWADVITTGLVSGMAGGLVVPAGRRFLLGDVEQDWLQDELELDGIDPVDGVTVHGKDAGTWQTISHCPVVRCQTPARDYRSCKLAQ